MSQDETFTSELDALAHRYEALHSENVRASGYPTSFFTLLTFALLLMVCGPPLFAQTPPETTDVVITDFLARQAEKEGAEEYGEARKVIAGDLNGDRREDAVVLYTLEGFDGSNLYVQYLAVFVRRGAGLRYMTHLAVGGKDRRSLELEGVSGGKILLKTEEYRPGDASCCPSKKGRARFVLSRGKLREL